MKNEEFSKTGSGQTQGIRAEKELNRKAFSLRRRRLAWSPRYGRTNPIRRSSAGRVSRARARRQVRTLPNKTINRDTSPIKLSADLRGRTVRGHVYGGEEHSHYDRAAGSERCRGRRDTPRCSKIDTLCSCRFVIKHNHLPRQALDERNESDPKGVCTGWVERGDVVEIFTMQVLNTVPSLSDK